MVNKIFSHFGSHTGPGKYFFFLFETREKRYTSKNNHKQLLLRCCYTHFEPLLLTIYQNVQINSVLGRGSRNRNSRNPGITCWSHNSCRCFQFWACPLDEGGGSRSGWILQKGGTMLPSADWQTFLPITITKRLKWKITSLFHQIPMGKVFRWGRKPVSWPPTMWIEC